MGQKKIFIETYGCQMNKAESKAFHIEFEKAGWTPVTDELEADIILLNTCSVRNKAEERIWGRIGYYRFLKKNNDFKLIITGCMAERLKNKLKDQNKTVDVVVGNFQKQNLISICDNAYQGTLNFETNIRPANESGIYTGAGTYQFQSLHEQDNFKAFIPIMHGCNNYCSYCIVPYVRGPEISRSPHDILAEISKLDSQNVKEITLLGQNVNSYVFIENEHRVDFNDLLSLIMEKVSSISWIRFLTSHPKDFPLKLIDTIAQNRRLCHHIHLPVQHGSDSILNKMNRGYTISYYMNLIQSLKKRITDIAITTDILIGFPGETNEDFEATLTLMKEVEFADAFMYRYSVREGTKAADFKDDIPEELKLERLARVINLQQQIGLKKKKEKLGQSVRVLVEKRAKKGDRELLARTEYDEMVVFPGPESAIGTFVQVKLESLQGNTYKGREMPCPGD